MPIRRRYVEEMKFRLTPEQKEELIKYAKWRNLDLAEVLREIIDETIAMIKENEQLRQELLANANKNR